MQGGEKVKKVKKLLPVLAVLKLTDCFAQAITEMQKSSINIKALKVAEWLHSFIQDRKNVLTVVLDSAIALTLALMMQFIFATA